MTMLYRVRPRQELFEIETRRMAGFTNFPAISAFK